MVDVVEEIKATVLKVAREQAEREGIPVCEVLERMQEKMWRALDEAYKARRYRVAELHMEGIDYVREVKREQGCELI